MRLPILALACVALAVSLSTAQHAPGLDAGPPDPGAGSAEDLRRLTNGGTRTAPATGTRGAGLMPRGPVITSRTREVWAAVKEHGGQRPAARALGISLRAVQDHIAKAQRLVDDQGPALSAAPPGRGLHRRKTVTRVVSAKGIRTLADLLDAAMVKRGRVGRCRLAGQMRGKRKRKDGSVQAVCTR